MLTSHNLQKDAQVQLVISLITIERRDSEKNDLLLLVIICWKTVVHGILTYRV